MQQTFYCWAANGQELRNPSRAKSWLFTTLYREFIKARHHESLFAQVDLSDVPEGNTDVDLIPEEVDSAAVREILFSFEEIYRAPLVLFYLNQLSYREIARQLPKGPGCSSMHRAELSEDPVPPLQRLKTSRCINPSCQKWRWTSRTTGPTHANSDRGPVKINRWSHDPD